jgi:hypothetical protein
MAKFQVFQVIELTDSFPINDLYVLHAQGRSATAAAAAAAGGALAATAAATAQQPGHAREAASQRTCVLS